MVSQREQIEVILNRYVDSGEWKGPHVSEVAEEIYRLFVGQVVCVSTSVNSLNAMSHSIGQMIEAGGESKPYE